MKKIINIALLLAMSFTLATAGNKSPKDMADVIARAINTDGGAKWYTVFGHVALYNSSKKKILEVTNVYPAIHENSVSSMTNTGHYWGTRYGIGTLSQRYRVLAAGYRQIPYSPIYTYSPYYTEGKWVKKWKWSWRKGWYKKWIRQRARFRCDSFIYYTYLKGTGTKIIKHSRWATTPNRVYKAMPHQR